MIEESQVRRLSEARVLCVGDVMLDHFVYGDVTRISPEAPIPVLHTRRRESMLGGAGNAVRNLASLGAQVNFVSVIGDDQAGKDVETLCTAIDGIELALVREPHRTTSTKTRYIASHQQLLRADSETTDAVTPETLEALRQAFETAIPNTRAVLVCDYAKGVLAGSNSSILIQIAQRARCPVIVDPKGTDFRRYAGATILKPNLKELAIATAMEVHTEAQQLAAAGAVIEATGARYVLITRGSEGMLLVQQNAPPRTFPSRAREIYDVTGAGDTVAAVLAASLSAGLEIGTAVEMANIAAGIVVGKLGTAVASPEEILRNLGTLQ